MTRFAEPEVIACPHCAARYLRVVLLSFNTMMQKTFSDGGSVNGLQDTLCNVARCPNCEAVIKDILSLDLVELPPKRRFWEKLIGKEPEYSYLPKPSFDVYLELFENDTQSDLRFNWALKALQVFNQTYRMYGNEQEADAALKQQYHRVCQFILHRYTDYSSDEMTLLCADIYRQVGDFQSSLHLYNKVDDHNLSHIVEPAKHWCEQGITSLMEIGGRSGQKQSRIQKRRL
ncbi:hypothetical protein [Aliiglaciecola aliphaticivorans]